MPTSNGDGNVHARHAAMLPNSQPLRMPRSHRSPTLYKWYGKKSHDSATRVGGGSIVFAGAGWAVCQVRLPSPALFCPVPGLRRPSCLFTHVLLFRWRRPCSCSPYLMGCGSLRAFVHLLSSPASFSLLAPSYLFASSRRLSCVCVQLRCIPCFACGGLYVCVWYGQTLRSLCMWGGHVFSATPLRLPFILPLCWRPRLASPSPRVGPGVTCSRVRPVGRRRCWGA